MRYEFEFADLPAKALVVQAKEPPKVSKGLGFKAQRATGWAERR